jgi:hypothetical protein
MVLEYEKPQISPLFCWHKTGKQGDLPLLQAYRWIGNLAQESVYIPHSHLATIILATGLQKD